MKRKWFAAIALLVMMGIVLTGCNPFKLAALLASKPGESSSPPAEQSTGGEVQPPVEDQTYFTEAGDFCNGLAWVRSSRFDAGGNWVGSKRCVIDTSGRIVYEMPEAFTWEEHKADFQGTDFIRGVSMINQQALVNSEGQVVWSLDGDGWQEADARFGQGNVESMGMTEGGRFRGYAFVWFHVNTFEETATYYGILDNDGTWYVEPTKEFNKVQALEDGLYRLTVQNEAGYYSTYEYYNIEENKRSDDNEEINRWRMEYRFQEHGGLLYDQELGGFCDQAGNLAIDLSEYTIGGEPEFYNGYCVLDLYNEQGAPYVTVIDATGKQLFEPKKKVKHNGMVSDGLLRVDNDNGSISYWNVDGEVAIGPVGYDTAGTYHDGLVAVSERNRATGHSEYFYLDTSGNRVIGRRPNPFPAAVGAS